MVLVKLSKLDMELNNTQGITDNELIAKLQSLTKDIVVDEIELDKEWIISHKWDCYSGRVTNACERC